jgi:hypothetical protein
LGDRFLGYEAAGANDYACELARVQQAVDRVAGHSAQELPSFGDGVKSTVFHETPICWEVKKGNADVTSVRDWVASGEHVKSNLRMTGLI